MSAPAWEREQNLESFNTSFLKKQLTKSRYPPYIRLNNCFELNMNKSQRKTLVKIFQEPVATDIRWNEIENLFVATGAKISEGKGSRIRVKYIGVPPAVFHRPHPRPETDKGAVKSVRRLLMDANIVP